MPPNKQPRASDSRQLTIAPPRPRSRPRKSLGDTSTASVATKQKPGRKPKSKTTAAAAAEAPNKRPRKAPVPAAASTSYHADTTAYDSPSEDSEASALSVVSDLSSSDDDEDGLSVVSESTLSSNSSASEDTSQANRKRKSKRGWPSEKERANRWRRLTLSEREAVTSEGGIVWSECREVLASLSNKKSRSIMVDEVSALLARVERRLEKCLVPPLLKVPGVTAGSAAPFIAQQRKDVPSSLLSWRIEREGGELLDEQAGVKLGMDAEIAELESQLLPEAEQAVDLTRAYRDQQRALGEAIARIQDLKKERKRLKAALRSNAQLEKIKNVVEPLEGLQQLESNLLAYF